MLLYILNKQRHIFFFHDESINCYTKFNFQLWNIKNMSINSVNLTTYSSNDGVKSYINTTLQAPEVSILVKYKNLYFNKKILDIGCGAGRTSFYLQNFTNDYLGVDYSKSMIEFCENNFKNLDFQHYDARDLSGFSDESFDFILFSYNGIDYISHHDRIKAFKEINRVLKKGGSFIFSTHNRNYKDIITKPRLHLSLNPKKLIINILAFLTQYSNHKKNKAEQIYEDEYAIINDSGNNFSLLTYYIDKDKQSRQLSDNNFKLLEMFGMDGKTITENSHDSENAWIYFVAQKV